MIAHLHKSTKQSDWMNSLDSFDIFLIQFHLFQFHSIFLIQFHSIQFNFIPYFEFNFIPSYSIRLEFNSI